MDCLVRFFGAFGLLFFLWSVSRLMVHRTSSHRANSFKLQLFDHFKKTIGRHMVRKQCPCESFCNMLGSFLMALPVILLHQSHCDILWRNSRIHLAFFRWFALVDYLTAIYLNFDGLLDLLCFGEYWWSLSCSFTFESANSDLV